MNMLVRFFILMSLLKREQKNDKNRGVDTEDASNPALNKVLAPFERDYRILPHDMGFRNHLPNYRYLSFIELNITGWLTRSLQAHSKSVKEHGKVLWIISMQEMVYLKEIKLLDKISVSSKVEGWDDKYVYFQHHFYVKNKVRAIGLTKFLLVNKKGKLSPNILGMEGVQLTDVITTWNANQTAIKQQ